MMREMENDQLQYRQNRQKQLEADSSKNLEDERKGERMTLIEPPVTPTEPVSPNRAVIMLLGVILALGGAVAAAMGLDMVDTTVRGHRDLSALLAIPPLAIVPLIETAGDRQARARQRVLFVATTAAIVIVAVASLHFFYRPLDVLWQVLLRRLQF
jgi:hypothetical protein